MFMQIFGGTNKEYYGIFESGLLYEINKKRKQLAAIVILTLTSRATESFQTHTSVSS